MDHTFIFTLSGNDYEKGIIYEDEYLYCLTIIFKELVSTNVAKNDMSGCLEEKLFIAQKAFCIMFRNNHFPLHFKMLAALMKVQKHEQVNRDLDPGAYRLKDLKIQPEYQDLLSNIE